jgi:thiamine-monophosphate kinase
MESKKKEAGKAQKTKQSSRTEIKEVGKVAALERLFAGSTYKNSATTSLGSSEFVTTNKILFEGVDFDLIYFPIKYLGYKAALHSMGYLYAECCQPLSLDFCIGVSSKFSMEQIEQLWAGVMAAAKEHGVTSLTLDLQPSMNGLVIGCSAAGKRVSKGVKEIAPNSLVCINGNLGAACMGFYVLEREKSAFESSVTAEGKSSYKQPDLSNYKYLLSSYLTPKIEAESLTAFKQAKLWPTAGRFITKGLADTVKQIAKEQNIGINLFLDKIPVAPQARAMAEEINLDIITAIMNGGEEYRLLYIFPIDMHDVLRKELPHLEIIGHTTSNVGECSLISPDGGIHPITAQGW